MKITVVPGNTVYAEYTRTRHAVKPVKISRPFHTTRLPTKVYLYDALCNLP